MNIYVANLSQKVQDDDLKEIFEEYGEVTSCKVIKDRFTGDSRGFGFVEMPNESEGTQAIDELDGAELDGKYLKVNKAKPRAPRENYSGGGGGGGGRRY